MNSTEKMLTFMKMVELGIVPFSGPFCTEKDAIANALSTLPPAERRRAKRKFRKLYKKAYRALDISRGKAQAPTAAELRLRRAAVFRMLSADFVREK